MKLLIMGPNSLGKGTQTERINNDLMTVNLAIGELLRAELVEKSVIGMHAKFELDFVLLVPDNILIEIVNERISNSDC